jgi:hypothetical protein
VRGFHANGSTRDKLSPEKTKQSKSLEISSKANILQEFKQHHRHGDLKIGSNTERPIYLMGHSLLGFIFKLFHNSFLYHT